MTIRQGRYIVAETEQEKKVRVTEIQRAEEDPFIRRSEVQQKVNNSTLPVSSRAVNLAIEQINSNLDLKADKSELDGLATEDYVNEKIDEKEVGITEPELISKSVGAGKWMREGAYGFGRTNLGFSMSLSAVGEFSAGNRSTSGGLDSSGYSILNMGYANNLYASHMAITVTGSPRMYFKGGSTDTVESREWCQVLHDSNTYPDSNGVLHNSRNPIDTLNTSDMADTVVDNDLITVTSGAVYRAIKQLTDQITSLEARVRELEDGGV